MLQGESFEDREVMRGSGLGEELIDEMDGGCCGPGMKGWIDTLGKVEG